MAKVICRDIGGVRWDVVWINITDNYSNIVENI